MGVDTVISTIPEKAEVALIDAAAAVRVRRFVPSEFAGILSVTMRPPGPDRGKGESLARLRHYQKHGVMEHTVFICGVFYERFAPGGLGAFQVGSGSHLSAEGAYLINIRKMKADIPEDSAAVYYKICMTSIEDVAKAVVIALDLPQWPSEFKMYGERMSLSDILSEAEHLRCKYISFGFFLFSFSPIQMISTIYG